MLRLALLIALSLFPLSLLAQSSSEELPVSPPPSPVEEMEDIVDALEEPSADQSAGADRTSLNLLGEVNAKSGEARRNENVRLVLIDNNVLKEINERMGVTATLVEEFDVQRNYFGKEFGGSPSTPLHVPSAAGSLHGEAFWTHNNSAFSARSFFQVGKVQPARSNDYGFKAGVPLGEKTFFSVDASQRRLRGQVNGNVLVPAADEREPTARDPETRAFIQTILNAYPSELPNRTDINPRALNTNAPQNIDNDRAALTLERKLTDADQLVLRYSATLQQVEAFQLVGGQNPDTTTKNHQARITWTRTWSPATLTDFSAGFDRVGSLLVPEETSIGPNLLFSNILQAVGPDGNIPIDRAQNTFHYAGRLQHTSSRHTWNFGGEVIRRQVNGAESYDERGLYSFRADFGRDQVQNLLEGTASLYQIGLGSTHRGFRNWNIKFFLSDNWRATNRLNINYGVRYEPAPSPYEVNNLTDIPYDCDCNNIAPTLGLAYRINDRWAVLRANYGTQYGEIFPATYMSARFNAPNTQVVAVNAPTLINPLAAVDPAELNGGRSLYFLLSPDLASPYSHQYNFTWQMRPVGDWTLELGYVGSRSPKLLQTWYYNRARHVEGIPLVSATINDRRPDQRYFDIRDKRNGSRGYYDAAKVTLRVPDWAGLNLDVSYWYSKAIDLGGDYTNTASGRDSRRGRSPAEFEVFGLMKGASDFDQRHATLWNLTYETPSVGSSGGWLSRAFGAWQITSAVLMKTGTPFTVQTADSPGWGNVDGVSSDRPNLVDPSVLGNSVDHPDTATERLPREAFSPVPLGDPVGNLGRNTFRKDGVFNVNSSLSRRFPVGGDAFVLFQAEALNLTNHPQFAEPGKDISGGNFGQITNTLNDGRTFKLTLRVGF